MRCSANNFRRKGLILGGRGPINTRLEARASFQSGRATIKTRPCIKCGFKPISPRLFPLTPIPVPPAFPLPSLPDTAGRRLSTHPLAAISVYSWATYSFRSLYNGTIRLSSGSARSLICPPIIDAPYGTRRWMNSPLIIWLRSATRA